MKKAEFGAILSIIAYIILSIGKISIGTIGNSDALFADGLNSLSDILVSVVILVGIILAKKPSDKKHPYGHQRIEQITTIIAAFLMMFIGFQVVSDGVNKIFNQDFEKPELFTSFVAFISGGIILIVGLYNRRLAKKLNSKTLDAAAKDNLSDALISLGTGIAIISAYYRLAWVDVVVSVIIGLLIIITALGIFLESSSYLIDTVDYDKTLKYEKTILSISEVKKVVSIRARTYGSSEHLDIVISLDQNTTVDKSHDICTNIENILIDKYGIIDAIIHVEPYKDNI